MEKKKVVIIGGGITGLATAYYLQKEIKEKALPVRSESYLKRVTVLAVSSTP